MTFRSPFFVISRQEVNDIHMKRWSTLRFVKPACRQLRGLDHISTLLLLTLFSVFALWFKCRFTFLNVITAFSFVYFQVITIFYAVLSVFLTHTLSQSELEMFADSQWEVVVNRKFTCLHVYIGSEYYNIIFL